MTTTQNCILLVILNLLSFTISYGQGNEGKVKAINSIRKTYQQINDYKNYKVITIENSEDFLGHNTDNGGSLTGYYKDDSLKKIVEWVGLSNKILQNEYYYDKDKLIFVYSTESRYRFNDSTQSFNYSKSDTVFKGRYYFDEEKLIETLLDDKKHDATSQPGAGAFLTSGKDYKLLLYKKKKQ